MVVSLFFCKQMEVVVEDDGAEILGVKDWMEEMNEWRWWIFFFGKANEEDERVGGILGILAQIWCWLTFFTRSLTEPSILDSKAQEMKTMDP